MDLLEIRKEILKLYGLVNGLEMQISRIVGYVDDYIKSTTAPLTGIWTSHAELVSKSTLSPSFIALLSAADSVYPVPNLADQNQMTNVGILAKALVHVRTGIVRYQTDVVAAISYLVKTPKYNGTALALARELAAYVIAADLVDLKTINPTIDAQFRARLVEWRTTPCSGAAPNLIASHEHRPNNWGTMAGATRAAIAVYLKDTVDLVKCARVFQGYLGDESAYVFDLGDFGGPINEIDLSWQFDKANPVGINPRGALILGNNVDGVLPDDQRRGGPFAWPPSKEPYVWEALQGILTQAVILHRAGFDVFNWNDKAILRAITWLHTQANYPATGDDEWTPHLVNHYYKSSFPVVFPARPGKIMGWTDWTHT